MIWILMFASFYMFLVMMLLIIFKGVKGEYLLYAKIYACLYGVLFITMLLIKFPVYELLKTSTSVELADRNFASNLLMKNATFKKKALLDAPIITQYPELPNGCEVTSLAMMLQYAGIPVGKMELAKKVNKVPYTYTVNGHVYSGDPNKGFLGDMYGKKPGYGAYHGPIKELAERYLPNRIVDLTGRSFENVLYEINKGKPVWVSINTTYKKLPETEFKIWKTVNGNVQITFKVHAVLLTGYDEQFVYFNDPISGKKNGRVPLNYFKEAWVQMGSQAITYQLTSNSVRR